MTVRDLYNWCKDMIDDFFPILLIITFVGAFTGGIAYYCIITSERCPTCGVILYDDANYCYRCGTPVSEVAIKLENAKKGGEQ